MVVNKSVYLNTEENKIQALYYIEYELKYVFYFT